MEPLPKSKELPKDVPGKLLRANEHKGDNKCCRFYFKTSFRLFILPSHIIEVWHHDDRIITVMIYGNIWYFLLHYSVLYFTQVYIPYSNTVYPVDLFSQWSDSTHSRVCIAGPNVNSMCSFLILSPTIQNTHIILILSFGIIESNNSLHHHILYFTITFYVVSMDIMHIIPNICFSWLKYTTII